MQLPHQRHEIFKLYKHNFNLITFYLQKVCFPVETLQYPEQISTNAWDLARGDKVTGFSGTIDTQLSFPLGIEMLEIELLKGANGKMYDVLTNPFYKNTNYIDVGEDLVNTLFITSATDKPTEHAVGDRLNDKILGADISVVIDAGALFTRIDGRGVVKRVLQSRLQERDETKRNSGRYVL